MNLLKFKNNKILYIILILVTLFSMTGINYADTAINVILSNPTVNQVYKPGDTIEISGEASGLSEVALKVKNTKNELVFAAQPKVKSGSFSEKFTLDSNADEGKYTLIVGSIGLYDSKRNFIVSSSTEAYLSIDDNVASKEYKPGEEVEITGIAANVDSFTLCVRNSEGGRIFVDQPSIENGAFTTKFSLPDNTVSGQCKINLNAYGMTSITKDIFKVDSSGSGDSGNPGDSGDSGNPGNPDDPTGPTVLTIKGNGVKNEVSFSLSQLEAMSQEKTVFSVTSDLPEDLKVAAKGVLLTDLLDKAGLKSQAKMISFKATDGYTADFTVDELLNQSRYVFPGKERVGALVALERAERTSNFNNLSTDETPVLCFGQRAETDQTLFSFVKYLKTITVTTDSPKQWDEPTAKITTKDSETKVETKGGQVESQSKVYLECDSGGKIYYTTDGSTPDLNSTIFNPHGCGADVGKYDPIVTNNNTTVKAMVVGRGKTNSDVITYEFTVPGSTDKTPIPEKKVDESNIKRESSNLGNGRSEEKITLLTGVVNDITNAKKGSRLAIASDSSADKVRLEISSSNIKKAKEKELFIGLDSQNGGYTLPLSTIDIDKIAAELGVKSDDLKLNIVISKEDAEVKNKLAAKVKNGQQMLTDPIEFSVEIWDSQSKKKELSYFNGNYVERYILLSSDVNINRAIGVRWNEEKGSFTPVPTRFETKNNKKHAVILSRSNSLYTVLQSDKSFEDIKNNWAKEDIELLASKMLITGKSDTSYAPKSNVTRAEFAALLARALGLEEVTLKEGQYKDVAVDAWYAGSVAAAAKENIITGYSKDEFKPNKNITREEMTVMIARAAVVAGQSTTLSESEQAKILKDLKDNTNISSWAKEDVALAINAGIIKGMAADSFSPKSYADRAQSAAILKRFLIYIDFMS
ncbi:S-layer homology domain-containing protein [Anaerovorax odorimutans]|uniref:S-layer homology domain-containing protein n=1 Tax=Anaerovorax odorimutans TaxID=109327 RepID=UPI00041B787D|nr:S-layer homology domain-containing protein [Anaerovorax odorimutans]